MRCRFAPPSALHFAIFAFFALLLSNAVAPSTFAAGALTGTSTAITTAQAFNLTTQGTGDWAHWGTSTATSFDHKTTGSTSISNDTLVGTGSVLRYTNNLTGYTWTDGTPTASATNSTTGIYISGTNNGFSFTVPAGTTSRTLTVYVGGYLSDGKLTAHLSDGSAADFTDSSYGYDKPGNINSKNYLPVYTLTYNAASAGQTLKVTWAQTAGTGNVTLQSAALTPAAPAAPTNLVATPISPTQINLTWTASTGATSYNIKRGTVSGGPYTTVGTSTAASFSNTGLTAATHYYYVVTAVNGGSESVPSAEVLRTTLCNAPTNLTATATSTQISLTWTASAGATSYSLYRGTSAGGEGATAYQTGLTGTSATDTSVTAGTAYYYTVKAINNGGTSAASNEAGAALAGGISLTLITAVNNQASLTWSSFAGATSYNVKRSTTNGSGYTTITNTTNTSYIDQGLTNGTAYYYIVTALNGTTESAPSNQVKATPTAQAFGFLNVGNGSVLSGDVVLNVSMASNIYGDEGNQVALQVDGIAYTNGGDNQTSVSGSNTLANTTFDLETDSFSNGTHTLTIKDAQGNTATISVTFSNTFTSINAPSMFDTTGGDGLPTTAAITANLSSAQAWTVTINTYDNASTVIKTFSGNSSTINLSWDGTDSTGAVVPDDEYEIVFNTTSGNSHELRIHPNGAPVIGNSRRRVSKNKPGDCFLLINPAVYPNQSDIKPYLATIKADLAPSKGSVWNTLSVFVATNKALTTFEINRINRHFASPLAVFYVAAHGGQDAYSSGPQFNIGGHFWHAQYVSGVPYDPNQDSNLQALVASANYDPYNGNNPPAFVFIDSCKSAGGSFNTPVSSNNDTTFANDFGSGNLFGAFLGWNGDCVEYGAFQAPLDDWTFWRLDTWAQFTNVNQTYATDWANLNRDYNNKPPRFPYDNQPSTRMVPIYYDNANF